MALFQILVLVNGIWIGCEIFQVQSKAEKYAIRHYKDKTYVIEQIQ